MASHAPASRDESPDDEEDGLAGALDEQVDGLDGYPAPPVAGPEYDQWLAQLPSIGSANHFNGTCDRCCFHPKGRCLNGYSCQHCHFDHEKRKRKGKKRTDRAEQGSEVRSMPPTSQEAFNHMVLPEYVHPHVPAFPDPSLEMPALPELAGPPTYSSWYPPQEMPPALVYPPPGISPDPACDGRNEYILKLEDENRYLRTLLLQHLGPGASLPPSVVPCRAQPVPAPVEGPPGLSHGPALSAPPPTTQTSLSAGAAPFCPGAGWAETAASAPAGQDSLRGLCRSSSADAFGAA